MINSFENTIHTLGKALESIDENVFEKLVHNCVDVLKNGKKIIVSGLGKNVPVCDKFVGTMMSLGLNAYYMNTNSAVHGDIGSVQTGDLVILLTKSGETVESVYLNNLLKERDCKRWLLTFVKDSALANDVHESLIIDLEHEGDKWNIVPNNSTTLNLIVLQSLAMRICEEMNITLEQFKKNHPGGHIGEVLKNV